jgi:F0F1-type ATP synthase assembly protein I
MADNSWMKPLQLGWVIALWLTIGVGGGIWVDKHFGWTPGGVIAGTFLAFFACGYSVYRMVQSLDSDERQKNKVK